MSNEAKTLLEQLGLPGFRHITMQEYQAIETKDANTLYYIKGTSLVYKGTSPYGSSIVRVSALPDLQDAIADMHYFVTSGDEAGIYVLNAAKDGYVNITVTRGYVDEALADFINGAEYDGATGNITFTKPSGENVVINIPKDNFLSAASFNAETNILNLELLDGSKVEVPLAELMNVYQGGDTDSVSVSVSEEGVITADVLISDAGDNALEVTEGGLYVKATPITAAPGESSTDNEAVSAKFVYDALKEMAWK